MTTARHPEHPIHPQFTDRWSPRAFTGEAIPRNELMSLLEAARWAPSAYNAQPWRFIYAHRDTPEWQAIFDTLVPFNQGWAQRAAALVVIASARQAIFPGATTLAANASHSFDTGAAWANLALQASLNGWAVHGMAGYNGERLRQATGIPATHAVEAVAAVGRAGDKHLLAAELQAREQPNGRLPVSQLAAEGRFLFTE